MCSTHVFLILQKSPVLQSKLPSMFNTSSIDCLRIHTVYCKSLEVQKFHCFSGSISNLETYPAHYYSQFQIYCIASNFHGLNFFIIFVNYPWITKIIFTKISPQNAWLINEEVSAWY